MLTASFFGWHFDVVPTGSMEPAINAGGMVITRPAEPGEIKLGDPILFREPVTGGSICHRVIAINEIDSQLFFQTKGDANEYADPGLVSSQDLIGKTILYIPHAGNIAYLSRLHATPISLMGQQISVAMLIVAAAGLAVIGMEFKNMWGWAFRPHVKRRQEIFKKRKFRLARRKRMFA